MSGRRAKYARRYVETAARGLEGQSAAYVRRWVAQDLASNPTLPTWCGAGVMTPGRLVEGKPIPQRWLRRRLQRILRSAR